MPTKTPASGRHVASELAYLARALKAPSLAAAVERLAERARTESWTFACCDERTTRCTEQQIQTAGHLRGQCLFRAVSATAHRVIRLAGPPSGATTMILTVGLAGPRWAKEHDVLAGGDEVQGPEVGQGVALERALVLDVEVLQRLPCGEAGGADAALTAVGFAGSDLALQASREELLAAQRVAAEIAAMPTPGEAFAAIAQFIT
jgi:hypothetical protein